MKDFNRGLKQKHSETHEPKCGELSRKLNSEEESEEKYNQEINASIKQTYKNLEKDSHQHLKCKVSKWYYDY